MMRIAYVCADPGVPVFGNKGASVHVQEVVRALRRRGAQVELMTTRTGPNQRGDLDDLRVHSLPAVGGGAAIERESKAIAANAGLESVLKSQAPYDLIYERYSLWSYAAMAYARTAGVPSVLEVNAPLIDEQARHRGLAQRSIAEGTARAAFHAADTIVAVSKDVARWVAGSASPDKVHVVSNGVDPERFIPSRARNENGGTFTIGFVGTLKPWHGVETVIDAMGMLSREHPVYRLVVVGEGPLLADLRRRAGERGISSMTTFSGATDPRDVPGLLAGFDAAVAPYPDLTDFYFSPLKLFEYLAAGVPVVSSSIGQIEDILTDGVTGLLCHPGDPSALARALEALRLQPDLAASLGRRGRELVLRDHTWDSVVERILGLLGRDLAAKGAA